MIQRSDWSAAQSLADEGNIFSLDIFDDHAFDFVQEVDSEIADSVSEDGLLYEKNVAATLLDLFDNVENVGSFFLKYSVHCGVIRNNDVVVHLSIIMPILDIKVIHQIFRLLEKILTSVLGGEMQN